MDTGDSQKKKQDKRAEKKQDKKGKKKVPFAVKIFFLSVLVSALLSFLSNEALAGAGLVLAFGVLAAFVLLGILFDIIGTAVTAAEERPFHSMAAHKVPGAREALKLIRKANEVSSFCNDVVGDICGIISGSTAAVIVVRLQDALNFRSIMISLAITALVSAFTISGKAIGKTFAINKSTTVLHLVGRVLHLFSTPKR